MGVGYIDHCPGGLLKLFLNRGVSLLTGIANFKHCTHTVAKCLCSYIGEQIIIQLVINLN